MRRLIVLVALVVALVPGQGSAQGWPTVMRDCLGGDYEELGYTTTGDIGQVAYVARDGSWSFHLYYGTGQGDLWVQVGLPVADRSDIEQQIAVGNRIVECYYRSVP